MNKKTVTYSKAKFCLFSAAVFAAQSSQAYSLSRELALQQHVGDEAEFELVENDNGDVLSVIGRFNSSPVSRNATSNEVEAAVSSLLRNWTEYSGLSLRSMQRPEGGFAVAHFDQYVGKLRVIDMEVTAGFHADGSIQSINGMLVPAGVLEPVAHTSHLQALEAAAEAGLIASAEAEEWFPVRENVWETARNSSLERGWSTEYQTSVWYYVDDNIEAILDDESLQIVVERSRLEEVTDACNVRVKDFPRSGSNATSLVPSSNTRTEQVTCEASSDIFGNCTWQLRREPSGFVHPIARVMDDDGAESEVVQSCSSSAVPQFTSTADPIREQGAFYVENQMRFFTDQNVWSQIAPDRTSNVQITVDDTGIALAGFNTGLTDIFCNTSGAAGNGCAIDSLSHEYGHYVSWSYDGTANTCTAGTDEANSIEETVATDLGLLFWLDDDQTLPQYGATNGFAFNNAPSPHTAAFSALTFSMQCAASGTNSADQNQRISGLPFTQAFWEAAWNRNCDSVDTCTTAMTSQGTTLFGSIDRETTLTVLGKALGSGLSVLGTNFTYQQLRAQMRSRLVTDRGSTQANNFQRVFAHHGFSNPSLCTGC